MMVEKRIDDLIQAGWQVIESDFDESAFQQWRTRAYQCLSVLLGPEHTYTQFFRGCLGQESKKDLLVGEGVLAAVKERILAGEKKEMQS